MNLGTLKMHQKLSSHLLKTV